MLTEASVAVFTALSTASVWQENMRTAVVAAFLVGYKFLSQHFKCTAIPEDH